ncbi:MAG: hypothetical protein U0936_27135 [Planctomycetaceae bacterium]
MSHGTDGECHDLLLASAIPSRELNAESVIESPTAADKYLQAILESLLSVFTASRPEMFYRWIITVTQRNPVRLDAVQWSR